MQVTSVGATRIYRRDPGRAGARLATSIRRRSPAGILARSDYSVLRFPLLSIDSSIARFGPNAGFVGWETLAAGRLASREEFGFDSFDSEFSISADTRPLAVERYSLAPSDRDPRSVARWNRFRYSATL